MVYILIHIKKGGVIKDITKPAPKILMFTAGAVSALLIPGASPISVKTASFNCVCVICP